MLPETMIIISLKPSHIAPNKPILISWHVKYKGQKVLLKSKNEQEQRIFIR
jgi:hypothetical protein